MTERIVTGHKAIDRRLRHLARKSANKAARAGLNKGVRIGAKELKKAVPSRLKSVRATIGSSVKKSKKTGVTVAKFGFAVGKSRRKKAAKRSTIAGVGISRQNVHWWVLGTSHRSGRGKMPPQRITKKLTLGGVKSATEKGTRDAIQRELKKLKSK